MEKLELYESLASRFNQGFIGVPYSKTLIKILMLTFPGVEADIALKLPFQKKTLDELKDLFSDKPENLEEILDQMVWRGSVYTDFSRTNEKRYHLWQSLPGWADTVFWSDKDQKRKKQLAPLWIKYRKEHFSEELAREQPVFRVIPLETSLKEESSILPFDDVAKLIKASSYYALAKCACRQSSMHETCISLGSMARYLVSQQMAREINFDTAMSVLEEAKKSGLIYMTENIDQKPSTICCCCSCCCIFIKAYKESGLDTLSPSNYIVQTDSIKCSQCGDCIDICQMELISFSKEDTIMTNNARCIGCGNCVAVCQEQARVLVEKENFKKPPTGIELFMSRFLSGPDY